MALRYVLDEHLRGELWQAVQSHNAQGTHLLDVVRVGDLPDLPLGVLDPDILFWADQQARILVSCDEATLKTHLLERLQAGHHSPGIFLIRKGSTLKDVLAFLIAAAYASEAADWQDQYRYIP